jgi:hypothetical protein
MVQPWPIANAYSQDSSSALNSARRASRSDIGDRFLVRCFVTGSSHPTRVAELRLWPIGWNGLRPQVERRAARSSCGAPRLRCRRRIYSGLRSEAGLCNAKLRQAGGNAGGAGHTGSRVMTDTSRSTRRRRGRSNVERSQAGSPFVSGRESAPIGDGDAPRPHLAQRGRYSSHGSGRALHDHWSFPQEGHRKARPSGTRGRAAQEPRRSQEVVDPSIYGAKPRLELAV